MGEGARKEGANERGSGLWDLGGQGVVRQCRLTVHCRCVSAPATLVSEQSGIWNAETRDLILESRCTPLHCKGYLGRANPRRLVAYQSTPSR